MSNAGCPSGYITRSGDKGGPGDTDAGGMMNNVASAFACADLCNANRNCGSFEWSATEKRCARNNIGDPPAGTKSFRDYMYCVREAAYPWSGDYPCDDTTGWLNGHGQGCKSYAQKWCAAGKAKPDAEWTLGEIFKFPESNCCICGKDKPQTRKFPPYHALSCATQTRLPTGNKRLSTWKL